MLFIPEDIYRSANCVGDVSLGLGPSLIFFARALVVLAVSAVFAFLRLSSGDPVWGAAAAVRLPAHARGAQPPNQPAHGARTVLDSDRYPSRRYVLFSPLGYNYIARLPAQCKPGRVLREHAESIGIPGWQLTFVRATPRGQLNKRAKNQISPRWGLTSEPSATHDETRSSLLSPMTIWKCEDATRSLGTEYSIWLSLTYCCQSSPRTVEIRHCGFSSEDIPFPIPSIHPGVYIGSTVVSMKYCRLDYIPSCRGLDHCLQRQIKKVIPRIPVTFGETFMKIDPFHKLFGIHFF